MKKIELAVFLFFVFAFIINCGGGNSNDGFSNVTLSSVQAIPQISSAISAVSVDSLNYQTLASTEHTGNIENFFSFQCHMNSEDTNNCPSGTGMADSNKYTLGTFIGLIYHAIMYGKNTYSDDSDAYKTCSAGTTHGTLTNNTPYFVLNGSSGSTNPNVFSFGTLMDCVSSNTYSGTDVNYSAYHKSENDTQFAIITTRKNIPYDADPSVNLNEIYQVYAGSVVNSMPAIIAFNIVRASGSAEGARTVAILNTTTNRFIVKDQNSNGVQLDAIGVGGYDINTGAYNSGYFLVRSRLASSEVKIYCLQNGAAPEIVSGTNCAGVESVTTIGSDAWSNTQVSTYLGLSTDDASNLSAFITVLSSTDAMPSANVPVDNSEFPDSISATQ